MSELQGVGIHLAEGLYQSEDEYDRILAVIYFVNALMEHCLASEDEIPDLALQAYYCDYMQAQIDNGGMSQFVYNSKWKEPMVSYLRDGLTAIGAAGELQWVHNIDAALKEMGDELKQAYFASEYFGENGVRDFLDAMDHAPENVDGDNLRSALHQWIGSWDNVTLVANDDWGTTVESFLQAFPDIEDRKAKALAAEEEARSPEEWAIRAALTEAHRNFEHFNAFDMQEWEGKKAGAWHMTTSEGYCFALVLDDEILLFTDKADPPFHRMQRSAETDSKPRT